MSVSIEHRAIPSGLRKVETEKVLNQQTGLETNIVVDSITINISQQKVLVQGRKVEYDLSEVPRGFGLPFSYAIKNAGEKWEVTTDEQGEITNEDKISDSTDDLGALDSSFGELLQQLILSKINGL